MKNTDRFYATLSGQQPDRIPLLDDGIRDEVIKSWRRQNGKQALDKLKQVIIDPHVELMPDLEISPSLMDKPAQGGSSDQIKANLSRSIDLRPGRTHHRQALSCRERDGILMLRISRGLFLSVGVEDWISFDRFLDYLRESRPQLTVYMRIFGEYLAEMADNWFTRFQPDAVVFSEPIAGPAGPLISPDMYEEIVLKSYEPLFRILRKYQIDIWIYRSYANITGFISRILKYGFNCLWACERRSEEMDYLRLRNIYGDQLGLIGGINIDILRTEAPSIRREMERVIPTLLSTGRFIPLADGRVRHDIPLRNYIHYRKYLENYCIRG